MCYSRIYKSAKRDTISSAVQEMAATGNPLIDDFDLHVGAWAHIWDEEKKFYSSQQITNVGNGVISLEGEDGEFTYHAEEGNDHWTDEEGNEYMMFFSGSPEESANDVGFADLAEEGYELPPWYNGGGQNAGGGSNVLAPKA